MRVSRYILPTLKEDPSDAVILSHRLMVRAGLIRKETAGMYVYLPLGLKVLRKIIKHKDINNPKKWFCSEIVVAAMDFAGIRFFNWDVVKPGLISPNKFSLSPCLIKVSKGKTMG